MGLICMVCLSMFILVDLRFKFQSQRQLRFVTTAPAVPFRVASKEQAAAGEGAAARLAEALRRGHAARLTIATGTASSRRPIVRAAARRPSRTPGFAEQQSRSAQRARFSFVNS